MPLSEAGRFTFENDLLEAAAAAPPPPEPEPEPEQPVLIPVAEQKAAGVPPEETVTIADQKAGVPPPELPADAPETPVAAPKGDSAGG